ncbi:MAG: hypothetical protein HOP19_18570 [Acidobacteria bacterium]|nr:hypothetical protein [Acidobacteriota bacterium]
MSGMKSTEKISAHCVQCDYPIFAYHHICPMCSQPVTKVAAVATLEPETTTATTRFDFWVASLKRTLGARPRSTASQEL